MDLRRFLEASRRPAAVITVAASLVFACNGGEGEYIAPVGPDSDTLGTLEVTVKSRTRRVDGAWVRVDGASERWAVTDELGQAAFFDVQPGEYVLSAAGESGYGEVRTQVIRKDLARSEIQLSEENPPGPRFTVEQVVDTGRGSGDTLRLRIDLSDPSKAPGSTWEVHGERDGRLAAGAFSDSGTAFARFAPAVPGEQNMRITVVVDGKTSFRSHPIDFIPLPPVRITSLTLHGRAVRVKWERYGGTGFHRYEIRRGNAVQEFEPFGQIVKVITDPDRLQWEDSLPPLFDKAVYSVHAQLRDSTRSPGPPDSILLDVVAFPTFHDAAVHPTQPVAYVAGADVELTRLDFESGQRTRVVLGGLPGYLALADAGQGLELFVPAGLGEIAVLDPATLAKRASMECGAPVESVIPFGPGRLLASLNQWGGIRVITRSPVGMTTLNGPYGSRLIPSSQGTFALGATLNLSPGRLHLFHTPWLATALVAKETEVGPDYFSGHKAMALAPNDSLLIHSGAGALYKPDLGFSGTLTYAGSLPVDSEAYTDFAFTPGSDSVYCAVGAAQKIRLITLPDKVVRREWKLRGQPERLFLRGGRLVCFSRIAASRPEFALEILERGTP